ncbi:D-alanyl-D-alanine carboxypeptidase family protein [Paenibacillus mendelii]|uniref:D-alanyl-D-alanine carboxypeptidase family protein n=1 Tax=Paenibacillus mendelii TaxID=206163 RepID=A0ABV6J7B3_9BACL|nr:D-alanyl-D-alanine carboxypeptidase family protein [Paenibacillus mendelii]
MLRLAMLKKTAMTMVVAITAVTVITEWSSLQAKAPRVWAKLSDAVMKNDTPSVGTLQGEAAVLMDERTGQLLYGKNEHKRLYPASTTKLLTALIALEKGDPDAIVTVGDEALLPSKGESTAGLYKGQQLSLRDLIAAMMLPSGNDAARTIARYTAAVETGKQMTMEEGLETFADMMNKRAEELGAMESHFVNPHGLHDLDHYTTAGDLALIARKARQNKLLRDIVSESEHTVKTATTTMGPTFVNRNKLLQPASGYYFDGANGMKTGYTSAAGYCLVASAKRGGKSYIAVILNSSSSDVWVDATKLLKYGFDRDRAVGYPS